MRVLSSMILIGAVAALASVAAPARPETAAPALHGVFVRGEAGLPAGWKPVAFSKIERHTVYEVVESDGRRAVEARADRSASGLAWEQAFDPAALPVLEWSWKITNVLAKGDIRTKAGDDLPARVLVMFPFDPDTASLSTRLSFGLYKAIFREYPPAQALSYVWANRLPQGEMVESAYTERLRHIAVQSGPARAGEWVSERRHIGEDFRRAFPGQPMPRMARLAIMVDTDNTGDVTTSWFAELRLSP